MVSGVIHRLLNYDKFYSIVQSYLCHLGDLLSSISSAVGRMRRFLTILNFKLFPENYTAICYMYHIWFKASLKLEEFLIVKLITLQPSGPFGSNQKSTKATLVTSKKKAIVYFISFFSLFATEDFIVFVLFTCP